MLKLSFLDFAIYHRESLIYEKLSSSPMCMLFLGKTNKSSHGILLALLQIQRHSKQINSFFISIIKRDWHSCLCHGGHVFFFTWLVWFRNQFLPIEMMKGDKTARWLGANHAKLSKVQGWDQYDCKILHNISNVQYLFYFIHNT